jgi:hypothetical protein
MQSHEREEGENSMSIRYFVLALALLFSVSIAHAQHPDAARQGWSPVAIVDLPATPESAGRDNPPCIGAVKIDANDVIRKIGYMIIDKKLNAPVMATINEVAPEVDRWIKAGLGQNNGPAFCATLCGIVSAGDRVKVCEEDSKYGRHCFAPNTPTAASGHPTGANGPQPFSRTGVLTRSTTESGRRDVVCIDVKHWSAHLDRTFTLEVKD